MLCNCPCSSKKKKPIAFLAMGFFSLKLLSFHLESGTNKTLCMPPLNYLQSFEQNLLQYGVFLKSELIYHL